MFLKLFELMMSSTCYHCHIHFRLICPPVILKLCILYYRYYGFSYIIACVVRLVLIFTGIAYIWLHILFGDGCYTRNTQGVITVMIGQLHVILLAMLYFISLFPLDPTNFLCSFSPTIYVYCVLTKTTMMP